ncbi:heme ABC transporter ATP-binding protein [Nannocystis bainbridge]|uniref:Heme ABC transporter ATP-binding protein n=1 Tax=Nannocystis bainbridge TaxID=2995303 RepID=A0ABT5EE21_9BACT|nr:heme ABC transporter ATP-binding protein [Nannocystis bainbridge]MDC0723061.1 heme ABC transporter ATP-binding protein [Nannocystis bainbridge]
MSLVASRIGVTVGRAELLRDLSLVAECARVLAVVGPSGAGKSTLLRVWAGEQAPSAGELRFDGRPLAQVHPTSLARMRAVLPQASALRFPLTALEVATLGRLPHPGRGETRRDRDIAWAALELAEVAHLAERLAPTLSGGEQQRVQLARVLAQIWEPSPEHPRRYLLLDEPTANLDPGHAVRILARLRQFVRATDTALVLVLHDLGAASQCADDLALLHAGRCVAHGEPADVLTPERLEACFGARFDLVPAPAGRGFAVLPRPPDDLHA